MDKAQWKMVPVEPTPKMLAAGRSGVSYAQASWIADRYAAMLAAAPQPPSASAEREATGFPKHTCGGAMSRNPHPDAGKPGHTLTDGSVYECIPCTVKSRHGWAQRALKAEAALREHLAPSPGIDAAEPWKDYAQHLEWCRTCAEDSVGSCAEGVKLKAAASAAPPGIDAAGQEPVAWLEHHKGGDNLVWDDPGGKRTPLYAAPPAAQPSAELMEAMDRMEALLDPKCGFLTVPDSSATVAASRNDLSLIRAALLDHLKARP